nr:MAG TPA: hypothetical protein [Caudoviricetes sp.]
MKRYKLLRELPTFDAGDEFYLDSNNNLRLKGSDIMAYNHKTLEKFPDILKDWFEEISDNKRHRVEYGSEYHYLNDYGCVDQADDYRDMEDDNRYSIGNYGLTEEEIETKLECDIARQVLLDDAEGGKFILDSKNWTGYYVYGVNRWLTQIVPQYYPGLIYFRSREALEKSLEEHKDQWEIVRKYEMDEL